MNMIRSCALLSILLTAPISSMYGSELFDEKKVGHIEIVIDSPDAGDTTPVLSRMKTREGEDFSQFTFDNDLKALSEEYERVEPTVQLKSGQVYITVHVQPRPIIHNIEWNGNEQFSSSKLQKELDVKPNTVFNRQEFNKSFNKVRELYFKKGYFESQLSYSVEPVPNTNQVNVVVNVFEGRPGHIEKIVLNGFTKDETSEIQDHMYLRKYNFLYSWLTGSGIYRDEILEQDRATILSLLQNKGYADARLEIDLTENPATHKLIVSITAHRGQIYRFGDIQYEGSSLITPEELKKRSLVATGEIYSPDKVRQTQQAIKDYLGQKGYIDANVQYETPLRENEPIFDVSFAIEEGQEYKIGMIRIFGNSSTKSNVILRETLLVPGETFDSRKLEATQRRLEAIGYFKSVNVYAVRTEDDEALGSNYRDVYIEVEETTTGNISLFAGVSSTDSIFGGLDLTERNFNIAGLPKAFTGKLSSLRGGGEFMHAKGTIGVNQNSVLLSWMNPYVNDSLWRLGVELSRTFSEEQKHTQVETYGGSVYANYPLSTYWTAGVRQRLRHTNDKLHFHSDTATKESEKEMKDKLEQHGLISAFSGNISYDSTDSAYKPHRGIRSYLEAEVAGIGGNYNFGKFSYVNTAYLPTSRKGTLKFRGDFRYILPFGKTSHQLQIPYSERLFLGGETTIRGYKPFAVGPLVELTNAQGGTILTETPLGGISSILFSAEYNYEVFKLLDLFAFFDVGSVTTGRFTFAQFRPTIGAGVRLDIGNRTPIMVGYGYPLDKKDRIEQKWQKWFFQMGSQF